MDPHSFIARAEAQRWIGIAEKLLLSNDFVGSKTFAIRARESDPRLDSPDQILAIADTLLAADKPLVGNNGIQQPDYYAILQLVRFVQDSDQIASQYRRLAVALNPHQNRFPYADQAFQLVNDAWAVLSNPLRKQMYDSDINFSQVGGLGFSLEHHQQQQQNQQQQNHQQHHQQQHQHNFFSINRMEVPQQQQQLHQHNFLSQNPVRSEQLLFQHRSDQSGQLFQEQVQPFQVTTTFAQSRSPSHPPPTGVPQMTFSWPQGNTVSSQVQSQPQLHQQQFNLQQQETSTVQFPTQINSNNNNDARAEGTEMEAEMEAEGGKEAEKDDENVDDSPSFWTTCPYCLYLYEYPSEYVECVLRCQTCKRAFQAVRIASLPPMVEGQDSYFFCWGFFPLAVSLSDMQKENSGSQKDSKWSPFSPMYDVTTHVQEHLNAKAAPKKDENVFVNKNLGPRIYIDDETDDIFEGISEPSDDSDLEWNSTQQKKAKRMKKDRVNNTKIPSSLPVSETNKKSAGVTTRRQSGRAAKEMGRLDLNVEFNNNEGEEPAARTGTGNRGNGQGDGDNIEGIGFFEGLDEFFSSLPILSVVNDDKVKAA